MSTHNVIKYSRKFKLIGKVQIIAHDGRLNPRDYLYSYNGEYYIGYCPADYNRCVSCCPCNIDSHGHLRWLGDKIIIG